MIFLTNKELDTVLLYTLIIVILFGVILFFVTGIYHVKKNEIYIIEKYNEFFKLINKGWYFFFPLIYHRAAKYNLNKQIRTLNIESGKKIDVIYQIIDPYLYHYSKIKIQDYLNKLTKNQTNITLEYLNQNFNKIGIKIINILEVR